MKHHTTSSTPLVLVDCNSTQCWIWWWVPVFSYRLLWQCTIRNTNKVSRAREVRNIAQLIVGHTFVRHFLHFTGLQFPIHNYIGHRWKEAVHRCVHAERTTIREEVEMQSMDNSLFSRLNHNVAVDKRIILYTNPCSLMPEQTSSWYNMHNATTTYHDHVWAWTANEC